VGVGGGYWWLPEAHVVRAGETVGAGAGPSFSLKWLRASIFDSRPTPEANFFLLV
jgi:hypothetical protein